MGNIIERIFTYLFTYQDKIEVIHIKQFVDSILPIKSKDSIFLCKFITKKESEKIAIMLDFCNNVIGKCEDQGSYYLFYICHEKTIDCKRILGICKEIFSDNRYNEIRNDVLKYYNI